jgi:hypothetical protein
MDVKVVARLAPRVEFKGWMLGLHDARLRF